VAGQWACHVGKGTPRDFGPCGTVLDRNAALVFSHPERYFTYLSPVEPCLEEGLLVPLYVEGKALGTIWVVSHDTSCRFDAEDLRLITSLAAFASSAYQALISLDRSARRNGELASLYHFTDRLYRAKSIDDIHNAALDVITGALNCQRASILICDDAGVMRFVAWRGLSELYREAVEGHSPWTCDTEDPQPICIQNIDEADLAAGLIATVKMEGIGALAFFPLLSNGQIVGKFMTYYDAPHVFSESENSLAVNLARQLGFAVERLRAEEQRRHAKDRQELLARELQHRTKNIFAVVQSVVSRSCAEKTSVKEAQKAIQDRLHSLAQTHAIVGDGKWQGADLAEVARTEMSPYQDRVTIDGPSLPVTPRAAQNFTLGLHELATNAVKYGALSADKGRVRITWTLLRENGGARFTFRWQEQDGPPVMQPIRRGFGSTVLEKVMADYCDSPPRIEFAPGGFCYELTGPLKAITEQH
jgi:two-component sensor histidine kinase